MERSRAKGRTERREANAREDGKGTGKALDPCGPEQEKPHDAAIDGSQEENNPLQEENNPLQHHGSQESLPRDDVERKHVERGRTLSSGPEKSAVMISFCIAHFLLATSSAMYGREFVGDCTRSLAQLDLGQRCWGRHLLGWPAGTPSTALPDNLHVATGRSFSATVFPSG